MGEHVTRGTAYHSSLPSRAMPNFKYMSVSPKTKISECDISSYSFFSLGEKKKLVFRGFLFSSDFTCGPVTVAHLPQHGRSVCSHVSKNLQRRLRSAGRSSRSEALVPGESHRAPCQLRGRGAADTETPWAGSSTPRREQSEDAGVGLCEETLPGKTSRYCCWSPWGAGGRNGCPLLALPSHKQSCFFCI